MRPHDYYRTVEEARILDLLAVSGWARELRAAPQAAYESAKAALERWVAAGLQARTHRSESRTFDPAEVINFAKARGVSGQDDFWEAAYVATGRYLIDGLRARTQASPARFSVRLERRVNLAHHEAGTQVRIHLPLPLEDGSTYDLRVAPVAGDDVERTRIEPGRLVATVRVPETKTASLAADISFYCHPERSRGTSPCHPERSRGTASIVKSDYLAPLEGLIDVTPRVAELAAKLGLSDRDAAASLRRIWDFMFESMTLGVVHYDALCERPLDDVLESGVLDCRLGSALLVALCRACGIPARMCSGYTLYAVPFYHYWSEVWNAERGWLPYDLICWDLSLRGGDATWRDVFFGKLDARMTTEILPRSFTGFPSMQFPRAWHVLSRALPNGAALGLFSVETGALVYEDRFSFTTNAAPLLP